MKYYIGTFSECTTEQNLNDSCMELPHVRSTVAETFAKPKLIDNTLNDYFGSYVIAICPARENQVSPLFDYDENWFNLEL